MPTGKAYPLPEDPQTEDLCCTLVFYPDKPEYRQALWGSLGYLATWLAWERDDEKSGKIAARLWAEANECTYSMANCLDSLAAILASIDANLAAIAANVGTGSVNLDPVISGLSGIETAITNLSFDSIIPEDEMSITINNCCCCNGGSTTTTPLPEDFPPDYNPPTPMPNPEEPIPDLDYMTTDKCAYAHYLFVKWRNVILDAANGSITLGNIIEKFQQTFSDTPAPINWNIAQWADVVVYLGVYLAGLIGYASQAASEIDSKAEAIKCAILAETSPDTKRSQVGTIIDVMGLPLVVRAYAKAVFNLLPLDMLYGGYIESGTAIPDWAYVPGCPGCVTPMPDPIESGLYFRDHTSTQGQCWLSTDGQTFTQVGYSTGTPFDFNRYYWLKGDVANHLDCEITGSINSSIPADCQVKIYNPLLVELTVTVREGGIETALPIPAQTEVEAVTSKLDFSTTATGANIRVWVSGIA